MLDVLYFAWVRERVGIGGEKLDLPAHITTPMELADWLAGRGGGYADAFADPNSLRCAVDQQIVPMASLIGNARELAFFPPVTGG